MLQSSMTELREGRGTNSLMGGWRRGTYQHHLNDNCCHDSRKVLKFYSPKQPKQKALRPKTGKPPRRIINKTYVTYERESNGSTVVHQQDNTEFLE